MPGRRDLFNKNDKNKIVSDRKPHFLDDAYCGWQDSLNPAFIFSRAGRSGWGWIKDLKNHDAKRGVADLSVGDANYGVFGQALFSG